jgi:hypothetical protein
MHNPTLKLKDGKWQTHCHPCNKTLTHANPKQALQWVKMHQQITSLPDPSTLLAAETR